MEKLIRWGMWCRGQHEGLSFPSDTVIYRAMAGQLRSGLCSRSGEFRENDDMIDTDRKIAALPEELRDVLVAEYVIGGNVRSKTSTARMPTATYYRKLNKAIAQLCGDSSSIIVPHQ